MVREIFFYFHMLATQNPRNVSLMPPSTCAVYRDHRKACERAPLCSYTAPSASRKYCYLKKRSASKPKRKRTAVKGTTRSASKPKRKRTAVKGPLVHELD